MTLCVDGGVCVCVFYLLRFDSSAAMDLLCQRIISDTESETFDFMHPHMYIYSIKHEECNIHTPPLAAEYLRMLHLGYRKNQFKVQFQKENTHSSDVMTEQVNHIFPHAC